MLLVKDLGLLDYLTALEAQEKVVAAKQREPLPDAVIFVEHPHVFTIGRGGNLKNVIAPKEVPVHSAGRGGDVTYHGPGQLVVYPIIDLRSKLRKDVHRYVRNLELSAIRTLKEFGVEGERRPPYTGIWVDDQKIAAIGVAVRRCITFHGLALNVNTDLSYFERIIPCGLSWAGATSMAKELGARQNMERVKESFRRNFAEVFGYDDIEKIENGGWKMEDGDSRSSILNPRPETN